MIKRKQRLGAHGGRHIALDDRRSPMARLLESEASNGRIEIEYQQQWRTFFKAQRLGLIDEDGRLTDKGKAFRGRQRISSNETKAY